MAKSKFLIIIVFLFIVLVNVSYRFASARETERELGNSKLRNAAKVIIPSDVSMDELKKIKKITLLITSTSQLFGQTASDLLAVKLREEKFEVTEESKVSEETIKQISKIEKEMQADKEKQPEGILNIVKIGQKLGLDAVFIGAIFEGKSQISFVSDKPPRLMEKIVVSTFYLQVVAIQSEKVVVSIILEYDKGENIYNAIDTMTSIIRDEMRK